jgi:hypothetical protein
MRFIPLDDSRRIVLRRMMFELRTNDREIQSPSVNNDAFPPAAVVFTVTVFSVAKRGR